MDQRERAQTETWAVMLMTMATLCNSAAQLIYKHSIDVSGLDIIRLITNGWIVLGLLLYGISGILLLVSLRGGEASVLYPIYTLSFIWIAIGASVFFDEIIGMKSIIGMIAVITGIILINISSNPIADNRNGGRQGKNRKVIT